MHYRLADYLLWLLMPTLQAGILVAMYRLYYTILQVGSALILAALAATSYTAYYYAYYANLGMCIAASIGILYEFVMEGLPWHSWLRSSCLLLLSCFVVLIGLNIAGFLGLGFLVMFIDKSLRGMQVFAVFTLLLFATQLGISRRSVLYGMVLGFGLFAAVNLWVGSEFWYHVFLTSTTLSEINSVAYLSACFIWLAYTISGSTDPSGFDRSDPAASQVENRRKLKPPTRWFFRAGAPGVEAHLVSRRVECTTD
jgi:hypothetical protein